MEQIGPMRSELIAQRNDQQLQQLGTWSLFSKQKQTVLYYPIIVLWLLILCSWRCLSFKPRRHVRCERRFMITLKRVLIETHEGFLNSHRSLSSSSPTFHPPLKSGRTRYEELLRNYEGTGTVSYLSPRDSLSVALSF